MKTNNLFLKIIFVALAAVILYWGFGAIKERYFNKSSEGNSVQEEAQKDKEAVEDESGEGLKEEIREESDEGESETGMEGDHLYVTREDCENRCEKFKDSEENLKYCQEVCGLVPISEVENCDGLEGLERDYCLKDLAVRKKDDNICDEIRDNKIKQVCRNRVAEEILSEMGL